jgi:hypothetical protein
LDLGWTSTSVVLNAPSATGLPEQIRQGSGEAELVGQFPEGDHSDVVADSLQRQYPNTEERPSLRSSVTDRRG